MKGRYQTRRQRRATPVAPIPAPTPIEPPPIRVAEHVAAWILGFGILAIVSGVAAR